MLDKNTVEHIAELARIEITEEEKEFLGQQLSKIIDYIDKLSGKLQSLGKELDTSKVEPLRGCYSQINILREDKPQKFDNIEKIIENFPSQENNFCKILQVIE